VNESLAALGINLTQKEHVQVHMGLAGDPGSGKTYSVLSSFPNPIVADFDKGTSAFYGRDITVLPFYDNAWCMEKLGAKQKTGTVDGMSVNCVNKRDAFRRFLKKEGSALPQDATFIVDSWTHLQENVDATLHCEPSLTSDGSVDSFSFWKRKLIYCEQTMADLVALPCSVVVMFHLVREVDKTGRTLEKARPLQSGQFKEKVESYFDNFFVQKCIPKFNKAGKQDHLKNFPSMDLITEDLNYLWQVRNSNDVSAKCALPNVKGPFVKASWDSIKEAFGITNFL
jgi:hypothetical protein